jgi:hypothetical protein
MSEIRRWRIGRTVFGGKCGGVHVRRGVSELKVGIGVNHIVPAGLVREARVENWVSPKAAPRVPRATLEMSCTDVPRA